MRHTRFGNWRLTALTLILGLASSMVEAKIVALDLDLPIDQVGPQAGRIKIGDHHRARIYYDDAAVDRKTHIVRVLHMQHLVGGNWIPSRLDPVEMPMGDAWLDLGSKPYRYHYRSIIGSGTLTEFNDQTRRLTITRLSDNSVVVSAPYEIQPPSDANIDTASVFLRPAAYVIHSVDVALDQVADGAGTSKVGDHDKLHIVYDSESVDPHTHRVKLLNFQHYIHDKYTPEHPDAVMMPMNEAWLDMTSAPYRMHFKASVVHGRPILIEVDETSRRLSIRSVPDGKLMEAGTYTIDPTPITGPDAIAAATKQTAAPPAGAPTSSDPPPAAAAPAR